MRLASRGLAALCALSAAPILAALVLAAPAPALAACSARLGMLSSHDSRAVVSTLTDICGRTTFFAGTTTPLTGGDTYTGTARDAGADAGTATAWSFFTAFFRADQAGVASIECSADNSGADRPSDAPRQRARIASTRTGHSP